MSEAVECRCYVNHRTHFGQYATTEEHDIKFCPLHAAASDTDSKARAVCRAWAEGDNDVTHVALLALFLHLFGKAPVVAIPKRIGATGRVEDDIGGQR